MKQTKISVKLKKGGYAQLKVPAYLAKAPRLLADIQAGRVGDAPFSAAATKPVHSQPKDAKN